MKKSQVKQIIQESIKDYVREIEHSGNVAALEAKINKIGEAIEKRTKKLNMDGLDEEMKDLIHPGKLKELQKEVKELEKSLEKYKNQLDKMQGKSTEETTEIVDEDANVEAPEIVTDSEEVESNESDTNESYLHMQKLAGVLDEKQYLTKLEELKKKQ